MPSLNMATLNVQGMGGERGFDSFLNTIQQRKRELKLGVFQVQEHNLPRERKQDQIDAAKARGFTLVVTYGRADDPDSTRGGVLTILDDTSTTLRRKLIEEPGLIKLEIEWGTETLEIVNIYAPSQPLGRVNFFALLRRKLSPSTIAGGDWNTVPDTTVDVDSANPLQYANRGSILLETIMAEKHLIDERREQLGTEREYTRNGNTTNGHTSTRLDRWYVPVDSEFLWSFKVENSFIFKDKASDHRMVVLTLDNRMGEMGKDRVTINEELTIDPKIQEEIIKLVEKAYQGRGSQIRKWKRMLGLIHDFLLHETRKRKKKDQVEIKRMKAILAEVNIKHKTQGATAASAAAEKRLQRQLFELENAEVLHEPTEKQAKYMYDKAEVSSKAMFMTYKQKAKQQWINTIMKAKWEEGKEPEVSGSTKNVSDIGGEFVKLFKVIFAEKDTDETEQNRLMKILSKQKILKQSREELDRKISYNETLAVMENLPLGKQAGPNRVPNGVFRRLATVMAPKFVAMINSTLKAGHLPNHFLEGDISMLFKKGERDDPRNYRPITLLNTDYKIFTRILAQRMNTVVHQFVSESQKGFVPDTFIAEASMLMRMVEAYINEDEENRKGIFLFLDMEKAFDRVSYDFTNKGLAALGFGENFRKWVGMMYNTDNAPRRRMFVNGYYSEEFQIKSGVAQGCPLSPLLFLIVAETLRISMDLEKNFKGIEVKGKFHKISQFADDTSLLLGKLKELKYVTKALNRWCAATGMRENIKKREGLGMGKYRGKDLGRGIKWAGENGWCISLGVPIGNNLNEAKWWGEKINKVRTLAQAWVGLKRAKYFGRNLIVQGMYFGRLRYWLYSINMDKKVCAVVQKDADILWWSKDPILEILSNDDGTAAKNTKRIRRWVAEKTAIGPKEKGGLNMMDWTIHVAKFKAQWIIRYVDPSKAAWKKLLDSFILYDKRGNKKYPEGRTIVLQNLSTREKAAMLSQLPKGATYLKECFREFWKQKIKPDTNTYAGIGSDSPWHGHRVKLDTENWKRAYFKHTLRITQFSDFMNKATNRPFNLMDWRYFVDVLETAKTGIRPAMRDVILRADEIYKIQGTIPYAVWLELRKDYLTEPKKGMRVYLIRGKIVWPALIKDDKFATRVKIDRVGRGHKTQQLIDHTHFDVVKAQRWNGKWAGPQGATPTCDWVWKMGIIDGLQNMTISSMTKQSLHAKMKPPASDAVWDSKIGAQPWDRVHAQKYMYTSPRDTVALLQLQHRNLRCAKHGGCDSTLCSARGCLHEESQQHLMTCSVIKRDFWGEVEEYMESFGIKAENTETFWLTGAMNGDTGSKEQAGIRAIAWRSLYAEVVRARIDKKLLHPQRAFFSFTRMVLSRVKAHGAKWRRWYNGQRFRSKERRKEFPAKQHGNNALIQIDEEATYQIHPELKEWLLQARMNQQGVDEGM